MTWEYESIPQLDNKLAVVTGANRGIGYEVTKELIKHNCDVVMACRNIDSAEEAKNNLIEEFPNADLSVIPLDLADIEAIHQFKDEFTDQYTKVDYLVNNAGIFHSPQLESEDGYELHLAVNHLGHFLLSSLLFDNLKNADMGRIVTVTSIGYKLGQLNLDDLNLTDNYTRTKGYAQSKLANLMFAIELQRKLDENNKDNLLSIATHPGVVETDIYKTGPHLGKLSFWNWFYYPFYFFFSQSVNEGSLPILRAITDPTLQGGEFIGPKGLLGISGDPEIIKPKPKALDEEKAERLWELSEEMTGRKFEI